jgi:hypothetical protein
MGGGESISECGVALREIRIEFDGFASGGIGPDVPLA